MPLTRTVSFEADRFNSHGNHCEEVEISFNSYGNGQVYMTIVGERRTSHYSITQEAVAALVEQLQAGVDG